MKVWLAGCVFIKRAVSGYVWDPLICGDNIPSCSTEGCGIEGLVVLAVAFTGTVTGETVAARAEIWPSGA